MAKKNKAYDHSKYSSWIDPNSVTPYERNAKIHDEKQIKNIVNSIRRFGWQQDVVITSDNVLVIGHGRRLAALQLGCEMPYHVIDKTADELTDEDIRELRIADNQTNAETGLDFDVLNIEIEDLDFSGFDFGFMDAVEKEEEQENKYTSVNSIPQYIPQEIPPSVEELISTGKVEGMIEEINGASVSEAEKRFLRTAAYRHAVIDFDKVADYYASASPEMQRLMERNALVLIDVDNAIANGFTTLTVALDEIMEDDMDE